MGVKGTKGDKWGTCTQTRLRVLEQNLKLKRTIYSKDPSAYMPIGLDTGFMGAK